MNKVQPKLDLNSKQLVQVARIGLQDINVNEENKELLKKKKIIRE